MPPTLTSVTGTIYNASGTAITTGKLYITLPQDIVVGGTKIVPSTVVVDLAATSGAVSVSLAPTESATPSGSYYFVEYDPAPSDTTKARRAKDGYWWNWWNVPDVGPVTVGDFPPAHRRPLPDDVLPAAPAAAPSPDFDVVVWEGASTLAGKTPNVARNGTSLDLDGAVMMTPDTYTPTATFEWTGTFRAAAAQHVGFSVNLGDGPWAIISTKNDPTKLWARTNFNGGTLIDDTVTQIATAAEAIGSSHVYKIVWGATSVEYFIDGVSKAVHNVAISTPMKGMASDLTNDLTLLTLTAATVNGSRVYI